MVNIIKDSVDDLAVFGGVPAFAEPLHVGRPNIGSRKRFFERIETMLDNRWLTNDGPFTKEFEARLSDMVDGLHCIAVCNATIGLEVVIRALELTGEVIVPSFTFVATAHVLQWLGLRPIFCDIDPKTHCLDPHRVEELITPNTSAIMGVHVWGQPCPTNELQELAERYNIRIIYDAAHAFGCSHESRMIGNFGDAEVFSFHATKFLNSLEGGAIVTRDEQLALRFRRLRNFGFVGPDQVVSLGTNGKMNETAAAMGITSLESFDEFVDTNYRNYKQYQRLLREIPGLRLFRHNEEEQHNYQYIILEIDEEDTGLSRDQLHAVLTRENVLARRYFYPGCHQMEPYRSYYPHAGLLLPETERLTKRVLSLPNGTAVDEEIIAQVCQIIQFAIANGDYISSRLPTSY